MSQVAAANAAFDLTPKGLAYALSHGREVIERRIDRHLALVTALLAILDQRDGDPDIEDDEDFEPSIAGSVCGSHSDSVDLELDDADREPSLGSPEFGLTPGGYGTPYRGAPLIDCCTPVGSQAMWARGHGDDEEQVNEDGGNILDEPHDDVGMDLEPEDAL